MRSSLHFGSVDATDSAIETRVIASLQERLQEIERILERCKTAIIQAAAAVKSHERELVEARQNYRESQLKLDQLETEIKNLTAQQEQVKTQLAKKYPRISRC
jgi:chromosome segregation protein